MKRTLKNIKMLENLVEVYTLIITHPRFEDYCIEESLDDSTDKRLFAIDAALIFDEIESKELTKMDETRTANYEWYEAMQVYVHRLLLTCDRTGRWEKLARQSAIYAVWNNYEVSK